MNQFYSHQRRRKKGFTLIELMVSLTVLSLLTLFAGRIYLNYLSTSRDLSAANLVYEEGRFLMEKIVREVRQNAIDYEQYFNQNINVVMDPTNSYVDNYCSYSNFFYDDEGESRGVRNSTKKAEILAFPVLPPLVPPLDPAAVRSVENELYLINLSGNKRTILTRVEKELDEVILDEVYTIGKVAILRMVGKDFGNDHMDGRDSYNDGSNNPLCSPDEGEGDGLIDTWHCDPDFPSCNREVLIDDGDDDTFCDGHAHLAVNDPADDYHSFIDISPNALNVVDLRFIIAPKDDPWKAYNMDDVQIQPHITIQMTVEANPKLVTLTNESSIPSLTLTSTITTRNYDEIISDCQ